MGSITRGLAGGCGQFSQQQIQDLLDAEYHRRLAMRGPDVKEQVARELLSYTGPLGDKDAIQAAFAAAVKAAHPDTGGTGGDMAAIKGARKYLLSCNVAEKEPCPMCKGSGRVATQPFGMQCQNCKGTGIKP